MLEEQESDWIVPDCAKHASGRRRQSTRFLGGRPAAAAAGAGGGVRPPYHAARHELVPARFARRGIGSTRCAVICKQRSTPSKASDGMSDQWGSGEGDQA